MAVQAKAVRRVALLYHPRVDASFALAHSLEKRLVSLGNHVRVVSAWDEALVAAAVADGQDLVVTLGGDGTMLRAARAAALHEVPVVGINFGRLGYLTQLDPDDALEAVPRALAGAGSVEDRLMLRCSAVDGDRSIGPIDAVNDVFVGRGRVARAVRLDISVDSHTMARVAADGVVVATPVGSTAYSMSAGGPIVVPSLDALVLTPVVPHPTTFPPLVLAPGARIEIAVQSDDEAALSVDGQLHHTIGRRAQVLVEASPHRARFLRLDGLPIDYAALMRRLHP